MSLMTSGGRWYRSARPGLLSLRRCAASSLMSSSESAARSRHKERRKGRAMLEIQMDDCLLRGDADRLVTLLHYEGLTAITLTRVDQLVTKLLCGCGFSKVLVMLKSLGILSEDKGDLQTLISLGLTAKVMMWFEAVYNLLTSDLQEISTHLLSLIDEFLDYFLLLAQAPLPVSQLSAVLLQLVKFALDEQIRFPLKLEAIRTFNSIVESLSRDQRRLIQNDQNQTQILPQVAAAVLTVGDYELQVSLSEALCRLTPRRDRQQRAYQWFCSCDLSSAFCDIRDSDFEVDSRRFLNLVNRYHGDQRRVYTFPCLRAFLNSTQLFRPRDDKLQEFWIDFNLGSECLSFFIDEPQGFLWGSIHLRKEEVDHYSLMVKHDEIVLTIRLNKPIVHNNSKGQRVELSFNCELHKELEEVAGRVFQKVQSSPCVAEVGGTVQGSLSADQGHIWSYGRKKPKNKSQLKVLPLSSPSSEDDASVSKAVSRSRAEILFDLIRSSTPTSTFESTCTAAPQLPPDIPGDFSAAETRSSESTPSLSHDPEGAEPQASPEPMLEFGGGGSSSQPETDMKRKREAPDSGYMSDQTEGKPAVKQKVELQPEGEESNSELTGCSSEEAGPAPVEEQLSEDPWSGQNQTLAEQRAQLVSHLKFDITAAFRTFRQQLDEHFTGCLQKVEADVLALVKECQQHVSSLFTAVHQHRLLLLQRFETSVTEQLKQLEDNCTNLNSINAQILSFFQVTTQQLGSICEEHLQRLKSLEPGQSDYPSSQ